MIGIIIVGICSIQEWGYIQADAVPNSPDFVFFLALASPSPKGDSRDKNQTKQSLEYNTTPAA